MKFLICAPPSFYGEDITSSTHFPPLSLVYIGTVVKNAGHKVKAVDSAAYNYTLEQLMNKIKDFNPDIVGITSTTSVFSSAKKLAKTVKDWKDIKIIIGGIHATAVPDKVLETKLFDYIVRGEGEVTILELLEAIEKDNPVDKILGISYLKDDKVVHNPNRPLIQNIDDIPFPDYSLLPIGSDLYFAPYTSRKPYTTVVSSRGCPYSCIFCAHHLIFGKKYRFHSPQRTFDEVKHLMDTYGIREIAFKDSEFTLNKQRVIEFCKLIKDAKLDIIWTVNSRINHVDEEMLIALKEAGCISITYGVESGSQKILDIMKKQITVEQTREAIRLTKKHGFRMVLNFMIGNPYETKEDIEATIKFAKKLNPDYGYFGFTTPFPGTTLREMAIENNWMLVKNPDAVRYEKLMMNATHMTTDELKEMLTKAYIRFYILNWRFLLGRFKWKNLRWQHIKNDFDGAYKLLKNKFRKEKISHEEVEEELI